jgi:hypothetical protein
MLWAAPPANVIATDISETVVHSVLAFGGTWMLAGGMQYVASGGSGSIDMMACAAWGGVAAGIVMLAPIAGDVAADFLSDIRQGWERGAAKRIESESVPESVVQTVIEPEDTEETARIEGEWWYKTSSGRLCCYATPRDKSRRVIVSDVRMRAVFGLAMTGTPFSEREITERVSGLSGPRFRILKRDWRARSLYVMHDDRSGHFTATGRLIASVIADIDPPSPVVKVG